MNIKRDDTVLVISGKDRGRRGKVLRSFPKLGRVLVEGINLRKKHVRPRRQDEKGQIVEVLAPLPVSNVKLVCQGCNKATRVGYRVEGGKKDRVCKKCGETI